VQTFTRSANVKLDANGYGFCTVTVPGGVRWQVSRVSVATNAPITAPGSATVVVQPNCSLYTGSTPNASKLIEGTNSGNRDSSNTTHHLEGGEAITAEWIGTASHAGLIATLTLNGIQV
jgi:hypothetical protein